MLQTTEKPESIESAYRARAQSAEEVRHLCYQIAAEVHLTRGALMEVNDFQGNETLLAINLMLHRWKDSLETVAGGLTFDRLGRLEENGKAVAS